MTARSYLSIGDVLTLLRQEFPDVTISKIRFLESQGLVNPERTPSGYRKFYEHDVERLRWVLRQQREHFLPLKVIKDRLDGEAGESPTEVEAEAMAGADADGGEASPPEQDATVAERSPEPVLVGQRAKGATPAGPATGPSRGQDEPSVDGPTLPGIETPAPTGKKPASVKPTADEPVGHGGSPAPGATGAAETPGPPALSLVADPEPAPEPPVRVVEPPAPPASTEPLEPLEPPAAAPPEPPPAKPAAVTAPKRARHAATPSPSASTASTAQAGSNGQAGPVAASAAKIPSASSAVDLNGASLSVDELSSASGLDVPALRQLQEYGLLHSKSVAGVETFDEEALAVSVVAARFAAFGIEPRHLRLYKNAADREAGFIEQIVTPLVRQRNPEARARATETAEELTQLGHQLRGSLLRSALFDLLNG
jgi:DNA-binding transcriptional MerR regulator